MRGKRVKKRRKMEEEEDFKIINVNRKRHKRICLWYSGTNSSNNPTT
jgi:hypothetical protein